MSQIPFDEVALRLLCAMVSAGQTQGSTTVREAFALALMFHDHAELLRKRRAHSEVLAFNDDGA